VQFYERECGRIAQRFIRHIFAKATLVIALSEHWRERFLRICPTTTVEVLPNAVALPDARALRPSEEREPGLLFLGELSRAKGVYDLVRAFARIAERFPGLQLVCGGTGDIAGVRRMAAQLEVSDRVGCPGWLGPELKRAALAAASIFVLPSYAEGMPIALLEAMSWELPVIATPVGGIPEVITHEVNGLLIAPGDIDALAATLDRLLRDPPLRSRLGAAGRATVAAHFSLETALERLGAIYQRFGIEAHPRV
jgi:glycosyltransferase involved in cell wall biosynthesis